MKFDSKQLADMSNAVRSGALCAVRTAASGHVGIVLGAADIVTTIYANYLNFERDKFVLSAGHGSALLYSVLKLSGYDLPSLKTFRKFDGLPGHPEYGFDGVNATTGPLGQGVANAVGMALAMKIKHARKIPNSNGRVYCLCSDGDLMEGVASEAIAFAGRYKLNNFVLLWDDNQISIDGTALTDLDIPGRMKAAGFDVLKINGNDFEDVNYALSLAERASKPVFIQCTTVIGLESSVAGTARAHGLGIGSDELLKLEQKYTKSRGIKLWERVAKRNVKHENKSVKTSKYEIGDYSNSDNISTRELSGLYLEKLLEHEPLLLGGSADLASSTNTKTKSHRDITARDFSGDFINYGVREFAMGAIMNGLTTSGFRPYGGTFLVFSDYMRPAIRLSALSHIPTIFVFSHDSVCVGEDGPTHQPIEQIASLRLMPNINVLRPCNASEVAWAWQTALRDTDRPTALILSRQKFKQVRTPNIENMGRGAYIIQASESKHPRITLIATGSEVPLAVDVAKKLKNAQVVSMPSVEIFRQQTPDYRKEILAGYVVAIEAGATASWFEFADAVMGIDQFGRSGPGDEVYRSFGFDADAIAEQINKKIK